MHPRIVDRQARHTLPVTILVKPALPLPLIARIPIREFDVLARPFVLDALPLLAGFPALNGFADDAVVAIGVLVVLGDAVPVQLMLFRCQTYAETKSPPRYHCDVFRFALNQHSVESLIKRGLSRYCLEPANGSSIVPPGGVTMRQSHCMSLTGMTVGCLESARSAFDAFAQ